MARLRILKNMVKDIYFLKLEINMLGIFNKVILQERVNISNMKNVSVKVTGKMVF
jgi:hypothetical protein